MKRFIMWGGDRCEDTLPSLPRAWQRTTAPKRWLERASGGDVRGSRHQRRFVKRFITSKSDEEFLRFVRKAFQRDLLSS
jgi:hypothetical protein